MILIVEDSEVDFETLMDACRVLEISEPVERVESGDQALEFLISSARGEKKSPKLVLFDLNTPGSSGFELLQRIKANPEICHIPIIVLTSSLDSRDIKRCYQAGANSYLHKPIDYQVFIEQLRAFKNYWLEQSLLPEVS